VCLTGTLFGLFLVMGGIFHAVTGDFIVGAWWFILGIFLRETSRTSYAQLVTRTTLAGSTVSRFMTPNPATVSPDLPIEELVETHVFRSHHGIYPVTEHSRLIGWVSAKRIAEIPRDHWGQMTVRDLTEPCSDKNTVTIHTDAVDALAVMHRTGNSRLLVSDGDHAAGIVTLKDMMPFLAWKLNLEGRR
jgi:predicted transcriptional regulator